jgi:hypothetical protein
MASIRIPIYFRELFEINDNVGREFVYAFCKALLTSQDTFETLHVNPHKTDNYAAKKVCMVVIDAWSTVDISNYEADSLSDRFTLSDAIDCASRSFERYTDIIRSYVDKCNSLELA